MSRVCVLALWFVSAGALAQGTLTDGRNANADAAASVVRIVVTQEGQEPRTAAGFVVQGGRVITTFGCVEHAAAVEVTTSSGQTSPADGVAAYSSDANLVLLSVHWTGAAPPPLPIAAEFARNTASSIVCPSHDAATAKTRGEPSPTTFAFASQAAIDPGWGGAPLVEEGKVVGAVTGMHLGSSKLEPMADPAADGSEEPGKAAEEPSLFDAARPELIRSLRPGDVIPWAKWGSKQEDIKRASRLGYKADRAMRNGGDDVVAQAKEVLKLDDRAWRAWRILCRAQADNGDEEEALDAAQRAIDLMPTDYYAYTMKAMLLARARRSEEAIAAARQSVKISPRETATHTALGYALQYAGDYDGAIAEYQAVLKIDPKDAWARQELDRLREFMGEGGDDSGRGKSPRF